MTTIPTGFAAVAYDEAGNIKTKEDAKGQRFRYTFDALNRLTVLDAPGSAYDIHYDYDACANGQGRLCAVTMGRDGANPVVVTYSHNAFGDCLQQLCHLPCDPLIIRVDPECERAGLAGWSEYLLFAPWHHLASQTVHFLPR